MLFLLLAILLNSYLAVVFKIFPRFRINSLHAIVVNYWVCVITGSFFLGYFPIKAESLAQGWFPWSVGMGAGFIAIFNLIAFSTVKDGVAPTTIANKLSLVIPVLFALWLYKDSFNWMKGAGLLLAVPAVYFSTRGGEQSKNEKAQSSKLNWLWPVLLFIGSGLLDTAVNYVTHRFFKENSSAVQQEQAAYLVHCFAAAGLIGFCIVAYLVVTGKQRWAWRNAIAGVLIGVPNFFSIYYLIKLLNSGFMQSSAAIPVTNIGVVLIASICALTIFREQKSWQRIAGIGLSIAAILLVAFSGN